MYYYSTFDEIVTTHSALETDEYSMPCVRVHFERPNNQNGFDFADGRIPHFNFQKACLNNLPCCFLSKGFGDCHEKIYRTNRPVLYRDDFVDGFGDG